MFSTEDKVAWCRAAESEEVEFAATRLPLLGLSGRINPKKKTDPYTHDHLIEFPADLKSVRTPLFKAGELYGIDPQYAVTFNDKDGRRYSANYPNLIIFFDVKWDDLVRKQIGGKSYEVKPMHRTYCGFLADVRSAIKAGGNNRIHYRRRVDDAAGNAKMSWVFDVRRLHRLDSRMAPIKGSD